MFALDAMDKGVDVHFHAEPTKAAVLRKSYRGKKVLIRYKEAFIILLFIGRTLAVIEKLSYREIWWS